MPFIDSLIEPLLQHLWGQLLLIVIGCVLLVKGADWLVDGASDAARRWGISNLIIGLTIVAFGTSMPEFVVNMFSAAKGNTDLALTNILGSNMINTLVILGCTALVCPVAAHSGLKDRNIWLSALAAVLVLAFATMGKVNAITRWEGAVLLIVFIVFLVWCIRSAKSGHVSKSKTSNVVPKPMPIWKSLLLIVGGLAALVVGGDAVVDGATALAQSFGVSDAIIGLTVVALGTSLPELATSVVAAFKNNTDLALGNVLGSNIFNVFFVLGSSAVFTPLSAYQGIALDAFTTALGSILLLIFIAVDKEKKIRWWGGLIMLLVYAAYLAYRLMTL